MSEDNFQACSTCGIERDVSTLDEKGMCPFCIEEGREPPAVCRGDRQGRKKPDPPPEDRPKVPRASSPEKQAEVDEAFRMPADVRSRGGGSKSAARDGPAHPLSAEIPALRAAFQTEVSSGVGP